jgi:hypothetical protein
MSAGPTCTTSRFSVKIRHTLPFFSIPLTCDLPSSACPNMSISKLTPQFAWSIHFSCLPQLVSYSTTTLSRSPTSDLAQTCSFLQRPTHDGPSRDHCVISPNLAMARLIPTSNSMQNSSTLAFFRPHKFHYQTPRRHYPGLRQR